MFVSLILLAFSLNFTYPMISFLAIVGFFLSYGLGPGPVTWVVLSEVLPSEARTAGSSLGQACAAVTGFVAVSHLSFPFLLPQKLI
jgi:MFS family permease